MIAALLGAVIVGFLAVLLVGLVTGRIAWRQESCCAPDPSRDGRMRVPDEPAA